MDEGSDGFHGRHGDHMVWLMMTSYSDIWIVKEIENPRRRFEKGQSSYVPTRDGRHIFHNHGMSTIIIIILQCRSIG